MSRHKEKTIMEKFKKIIAIIALLSIVPAMYLVAGTVTKGLIGKQDISLWDGTSTKTFTRDSSEGYTLTLNQLDWVGVDVLQKYGGGVNRTDGTLTLAMATAGAVNDVAFWLSPGTWTISASITITSNITLILPPGAVLTDDASNATLTINGGISAGFYQVFDWDQGTGIVTGNSSIPTIYPEWFGAVAWDETAAAANFTAIKYALKMALSHPAGSIDPLEGQSNLHFNPGNWWIIGNSPLALTRTEMEALPTGYRYRRGIKYSGEGRYSSILILKNTGSTTWFYSNYDASYPGAMSATDFVTFEGLSFRSEDYYEGYGTTQRRWSESSANRINGWYLESTGWEKFFSFNDCSFEGLDEAFHYSGSANVDHNTFTGCSFRHIIEYVFLYENDQSVANRFVNCDFEAIYGSVFKVRPNGGGDLSMFGGSITLYPKYKSNNLPYIDSETELMPNAVDRNFTGGSTAWSDEDLGTTFDDTTDLTITANAAAQYCKLPVINAPTTVGKRYRMRYDLANIVGEWELQSFDGTQDIGTISANVTQGYLEWTALTTGGYRIVSLDTNSSGDFDNFRLYEDVRRAFLDVDMEDVDSGATGLGRGNDKFRFHGLRFEFYDDSQLMVLIKRSDDTSVGNSVHVTFTDCTSIEDNYYDASDTLQTSGNTLRDIVAIEHDIGASVHFIRSALNRRHRYTILNATSLYAQSQINFTDCWAVWDPQDGSPGGSLRSRCVTTDSTMGMFRATGCYYSAVSPSNAAYRHVIDFSAGYDNKNESVSHPLRLGSVKANDGAWPSSSVATKLLYLPEGSIVTRVIMWKPDPAVGTQGNYDLQLQDSDNNVLWSSGAGNEQRVISDDAAIDPAFTVPAAPNNYVSLEYAGGSDASHGTAGFFVVEYF